MTGQSLKSSISGDTEVAGTVAIAAPGALYAVDFPTPKPKTARTALLPPAAADRGTRRRLTQSEDEETIIINRPGRSTYPNQKSVLTSGATPHSRREIGLEDSDRTTNQGVGSSNLSGRAINTIGYARAIPTRHCLVTT